MNFFKKLEGRFVAPKADINLQFSEDYAVLGEELEGTLNVLPHETIEAEEIRCEITCSETARVTKTTYDPAIKSMVTREVTENRSLYQAKPSCHPATQLVSGVGRAFKFCLSIPAGSRPTYMSVNDSVRWKIKGVVAVHGRPDVTTEELEIQVISQSQKPLDQPPKIHLVACEYCQTGVPEDVLVCPNCGARKTA